MRRLGAVLALALAGLPAATASADIGPFRGVGTGLVDRYRHLERPSDNFYSDSKDVYRGRFVYSFTIDENGVVRGRDRACTSPPPGTLRAETGTRAHSDATSRSGPRPTT
jgi:hypothetical protein